MIKISNSDILAVENKLALTFDEKSREFIKCFESKDIQACPGAGKTTSLVAKLDIISNQMPFPDNSAVLVLTHTNVAVEEIRKKLGLNGNKLINYPNHVGTFQSFINKYLAIPMYINSYGARPKAIDNSLFNKKLLLKLKSYYLDNFLTMSSEANNYSSIERFIGDLEVEESKIVLKQSKGRRKTIVNKGKPSYRNIKRALANDVIEEVIKEGYLTFQHCYKLSVAYLDKYPHVKQLFQNRFKFVFIDEVQDTDETQFIILDKLFSNSDVVIQKIGDNNQAIFQFESKKDKTWDINPDYLELTHTKRLSTNIANVASSIALTQQELSGNNSIDIKPTIILFKEESIEQVINNFSELIIQHDLHNLESPVFKIIGGVAKSNDKGNTIPSYFPQYKNNNILIEGNNLTEKLINNFGMKATPKYLMELSLNIIIEYLSCKQIKNNENQYTRKSLLYSLKEKHPQKYLNCREILLKIYSEYKGESSIDIQLNELISEILSGLNLVIDQPLFDNIIKNYDISDKKTEKSNVYKYINDGFNFEIPISTVHKVKGETHTATLILETFKNGYDLFQLLDCLKGKNKAGLEAKKKLVYVAMTRATHFLCLAIQNKHNFGKKINCVTEDDIKCLEDNGFDVINL